jgi:ubiquinone/menaquinone biosynthesis C-methylase UbiE
MADGPHRNQSVFDHWNDERVESMYDKHLLGLEIASIKQRIPAGSRILDAGCGEGEGTAVYSDIPGVRMEGADFSPTRLKKAAERIGQRQNVSLKRMDFLEPCTLDGDYDVIVSQRFLINLADWRQQSEVIVRLVSLLRPGGRLIVLEGSQQGTNSLNQWRATWNLSPIPIKWHNQFLDDAALVALMRANGCRLEDLTGFGSYFLLTRGIRPALSDNLSADSDFNRVAASCPVQELLGFREEFSRLKLWVFGKRGPDA